MMIFQPFEPERSTPDGRGVPTVRVRSGGRLILNAAGKRLLGDHEYVQLLWEQDTQRLGIKPTTEDDPLRVKVTDTPSQSTITSKAFVDAHAIPMDQRMRLAQHEDLIVASTVKPGDPLAGAHTN
jgi:hypothetical protein